MKIPSDKQINFANEIAKTLNIDFPHGDFDFTAQRYFYFISDYIEDYKYAIAENKIIPNLWAYDDDITWGYDYGYWEY